MFPGLLHPDNPVVFFDLTIGEQAAGRMQIELFSHMLPKTCDNFLQLCTGDYVVDGRPIGYKRTSISKIVRDSYLLGGNLGPGPVSIYGGYFEDEGFEVKHDAAGVVTMVNDGPNTNSCRFAVTCQAASWMDNTNVAFGRLYPSTAESKSLTVLRRVEHTPTGADGAPALRVQIAECGQM